MSSAPKNKAASFKANFRREQAGALGSSALRAPPPGTTGNASSGGPGVGKATSKANAAKAGINAKANAKAAANVAARKVVADLLPENAKEQKAAARIILTVVLRFKAQYEFAKRKKELMDEQIEREAIEAAARLEARRFERQALKKVEEMRKKKEVAKKKTDFFDACYDGEFESAKKMLEQDPVLLLEAKDSDGYAPLSAAANGGNPDIVQMLLDFGANPNAKGEFQRTALWRAAFAGNAVVVEMLLESGADPAIYDTSFQTPLTVAPNDSKCENLLQEWAKTPEKTQQLKEQLQAKLEQGRKKLGQLSKKHADAQLDKLKQQIEQEEIELENAKRDAADAYRSWSDKIVKRMAQANFQNASSNPESGGNSNQAGSAISAQEEETYIREMASQLSLLKRKLEDAVHRVEELKLKYEEAEAELDPNSSERKNSKIANLTILPFKLLSDAVLRSSGPHAITKDQKFPLVWDSSGRASVFFEYSGATLLKMWNVSDTKNMRRALLNCVRHDVPFVLDCMGAPIGADHLAICLESLLPPRARSTGGSALGVGGSSLMSATSTSTGTTTGGEASTTSTSSLLDKNPDGTLHALSSVIDKSMNDISKSGATFGLGAAAGDEANSGKLEAARILRQEGILNLVMHCKSIVLVEIARQIHAKSKKKSRICNADLPKIGDVSCAVTAITTSSTIPLQWILVLSKRLFTQEDLLYDLLVDPQLDGTEFQKYEFALETKNFKFILLSSCDTPDMDLLSRFHVVRVVANHGM
ncbi:unnamed protein product [Amoebophrya sp. A120]|nr:unnamed protein product [Amoebophrya sp. A120]|eukprot:GSA120T00000282001.1